MVVCFRTLARVVWTSCLLFHCPAPVDARISGVPRRTEYIARVPCITSLTCHHGVCRLVDGNVDTLQRRTTMKTNATDRPTDDAPPSHTLASAAPRLVCLCDAGWATIDVSQPCTYARKNKVYIVVMQFFFGYLGAGVFLLGWNGWGITVLVLSIVACCIRPCFKAHNEEANNDITRSESTMCGDLVLSCATCQLACVVAVITTMLFVLTIVHCVDSHGVACK